MNDFLLYDMGDLFNNPNFQAEALTFFQAVGHTSSVTPLIVAEDVLHCIYTELRFESLFNIYERKAFSHIESLSHLFTLNNEVFYTNKTSQVRYYSVSLDTEKEERTVIADSILNAFAKNTSDFIVIIFRHEKKCMFAFAKKTKGCITYFSDWFDDSNVCKVAEKIDIGCLSLRNSSEFFLDFVYMTARLYYTHPITKDCAHIEWYELNEDDRPSWKDYAIERMYAHIREYGDDYIDEPKNEDYEIDDIDSIDFEFDLIELELELDKMMATESFNLSDDEYDDDDDDDYDDFERVNIEKIPAGILNDPVKILEWLRKNEQTTQNEPKEKRVKSIDKTHDTQRQPIHTL
jgi:hypothetical protein